MYNKSTYERGSEREREREEGGGGERERDSTRARERGREKESACIHRIGENTGEKEGESGFKGLLNNSFPMLLVCCGEKGAARTYRQFTSSTRTYRQFTSSRASAH